MSAAFMCRLGRPSGDRRAALVAALLAGATLAPLLAHAQDAAPDLTAQADAYRQMTAEVLTRNARGQPAYLADGTRAGWISELRVGQDGSQVVFVRIRPLFRGGVIRVPLSNVHRSGARLVVGSDRAWLRAEPRLSTDQRRQH